jgi:twitching motility protein PilT
VAGGYASEEDLLPLLSEAAQTGSQVGPIIISRRVVAAPVVVSMLAQLSRLPKVDLETNGPTPHLADLIPAPHARDNQALALHLVGQQIVVAFAEPPDPADVRALSELIGYEIVAVLGDPLYIQGALSKPDTNNAPAATAPATASPARADAAGSPVDAGAAPDASTTNGSNGSAPAHGANGSNGSNGTPSITVHEAEEMPLHVDELLRYAVGVGASDLHLSTSMPPTLRLHGALRPMEEVPPLDNNTLRDLIFGILPQNQRERFEADHELDTSHTIAGVGRFRVNVCFERGSIAVALRPIPHEIPEFHTLGLPDTVRAFAELRRGLVLVTGPTGSGKSTSLASLVDIINQTKPMHIVTVEDPIEFVHSHKRSVISQREVGADTFSFAEALRRVLRQDPDVILVGELRDLETISTALTAAETGHLVFATLHTQDAPSTIDRIIDVFPPNQQDQIRIQLGSALQGVVTQQLVPTVDGAGRCVAAEVLVCTSAIQNLIRAAKTHQIYSLMQTGAQYGMQTMDQSLADLVRRKVVTRGVALDRCRSEEDFRNHLHGH